MSEMLIAAPAIKGGLEPIHTALAAGNVQAIGKSVVGTVQGDLHDIGENLVAIMMEGAELQVIDLGADVSPERFVEAVKTQRPNLIGLSPLPKKTMTHKQVTEDALSEAGVRSHVKVMVRDAPVAAKYAGEINPEFVHLTPRRRRIWHIPGCTGRLP